MSYVDSFVQRDDDLIDEGQPCQPLNNCRHMVQFKEGFTREDILNYNNNIIEFTTKNSNFCLPHCCFNSISDTKQRFAKFFKTMYSEM
jgi:hypothetical protein